MDMSELGNHYREDQRRLAGDMRALVEDAEALLRHAVRDAGSGYAEARTRLEERLAAAKTQLSATERALVDGVKDAGRATDTYVHEHPWTAIGVGAGLGVLLGLLIGRR